MRRATGEAGELRVGYQVAATLGKWSLDAEPRLPLTYACEATVASEHGYWMTQGPMDLALFIGQTEWLWRGVTLARVGGQVEIELHERPCATERAAASFIRKGQQR